MRLGSSRYPSQRLAYGCCRLHHECRDTDSTVRQEEGFFSTARGASVARHGVRCCVRCQRVRYEVLRAVVRTRMIGARAQAKLLCCEHVGQPLGAPVVASTANWDQGSLE